MELTREKIRSLCTEDSFQRGLSYFEEGRVKHIDFFANTITAVVQGTDNYRVTLRFNDGIEGHCTCPYDWGGYCKHIVATLIHYSQRYEELKEWKDREENRVNQVLNKVTAQKLRDFLSAEFEKDPRIRTRFLIYFTGEGEEKSLLDYKKEINQLYRDAADRYGVIDYDREVDLSYLWDVAKSYVEKGNFLEAAKIFQALSEAIAENMEMVDDYWGNYDVEFDEAVEKLVKCLMEAGLRPDEKRTYIDYFFQKFIEGEPDYFQGSYDHALRQICTSMEDLSHLKSLFRSYLVDLSDYEKNWGKHYEAKQRLLLYIYVLDKLGEEEELYNLLGRFYLRDSDICLFFAERLLREGELSRSMEVAEEGVRIFQNRTASKLNKFLTELYKGRCPGKYRVTLMNLFLLERNWFFYDELKRISSEEEWSSMVEKIVVNLSNRGSINEVYLIDIYLKEEMRDEALRAVLATGNLSILGRYRDLLSDDNPQEYFKAYKALLTSFAERNMGRSHYREVVTFLKAMRKIKGFDKEFSRFVESLKEKYSNRPAFLDELKQLNE